MLLRHFGSTVQSAASETVTTLFSGIRSRATDAAKHFLRIKEKPMEINKLFILALGD